MNLTWIFCVFFIESYLLGNVCSRTPPPFVETTLTNGSGWRIWHQKNVNASSIARFAASTRGADETIDMDHQLAINLGVHKKLAILFDILCRTKYFLSSRNNQHLSSNFSSVKYCNAKVLRETDIFYSISNPNFFSVDATITLYFILYLDAPIVKHNFIGIVFYNYSRLFDAC